ncbi:cytochrome P450 [Streptomyces acidiscabies]|uniref:cytochrome P450 n=1 Tax=Streptomyces acidiscabies TaxID=42234 RepID=UPI0015BC989C|nr:cytochrome P450 [Streptomyces acidiscabies]
MDLFELGPTLVGNHILRTDGAQHARLRAALSPPFSRTAVARLVPYMQQVADRLLSCLPTAGEADLVEDFARPLAGEVFSHVMGLSEKQAGLHRDLQRRNFETTDAATQTTTAFELATMLLRVVSGRDGDAPPGSLIASMLRPPHGVTPLSCTEAVENLIAVYRAGLAPTVAAVAYSAAHIAAGEPALRAALLDPERCEHLIEELLRLHPPHVVVTPRVARRALTTDGPAIAAGDTVNVCLTTANRDPRRYTDPDAMHLEQARTPRHLSFGWGPHVCVGAPLVRQLLRTALVTLFRRLPGLRLTRALEEIRFHGSLSDRMPVEVRVRF